MDSGETPIHFSISDKICKQTGITAKWINDGKFTVYGYKHITSSSRDKPSAVAGTGDILLHQLQTEFIFEHPILRSLLAEASGIFKSVQDAARLPKGRDAELLNLSRTYRSTVRACLEQLQDALAALEAPSPPHQLQQQPQKTTDCTSTLENYITIFYSVECVWHLCEILLIDQSPANVVVPQLLEWARFHFPAYERRAAELLFIDRGDEMDEEEGANNAEVLAVCKGLITQGQVDVARTLLRLHTASESTSFRTVDDILRSMPVYSAYGGLSVQKLRTQWQYWVSDTESKLSTGCMAAEPDLERIVQLVSGQQTAWIEHARQTSTCWYEFLPGFLFYTEPACKYFELGTFADAWLRRWSEARGGGAGSSAVGGLKHLDRVIFKVMENDMHQVVHDCQNMCDNKWFVTHLTDLLYHCGQLEIVGEQQTNVTGALRESLLFDFGTALMSRNGLWLIGVDYLGSSSTEGLGAIELLLPRIPVANERQAMKIIALAKSRGYAEVERELCRVQAVRALSNNRYGNALEWAIRSHDNIFVTAVADRFLNHYSKTGQMLCHDLLANIGAKMFISPRLVFLVKYFDFHEYYKCGEFPQAAELLVNLLDSKITPEYFWPSLLADTIPLLESKEPQFSSKETYIILQHLENQLIPLIAKKKEALRTGKSQSLDLLNDCRIENVEDVVRLIRLACARNLSRALIIENTVMP